MATEKRLTYVEDVIALFEKDIAESRDALKTAYHGDKDEIRAEMNGVRAALHILKHHASHGGTVDAVPVVRCKDCVSYEERCPGFGYCYHWDYEQGMSPNQVDADDFCSYGERRTDD